MGCPKRVIVVLLSFLGFLILFGFRTVFTMVMVYVITDNDNDEETIFKVLVLFLSNLRKRQWKTLPSSLRKAPFLLFLYYVCVQRSSTY